MITLSTSGSSIVFEFSGNSTYLNDGTITVPQNSLALIVDESDMVSFKKANSNDLFVSANISEFGMTKDELISWYETNMVGSEGVTSGDVQSMIDASVADYFDGVEYDSGTTRINFYHGNTVKAYIDASDFVIDGMIDDVRIETISGVTYLVIDFNTESGKEDIQIPLTDIFNPDNYYTKSETSGATEIATALSGKQDTLSAGTNITIVDNVISAEGGGKAIEAGRGIAVTTGETADTVSFDLPMSADTIGLAFFNTKESGAGEISTGSSKNRYNIVLSGYYNKIGGNGSNREFDGNFISGWNSKIFDNTYSFDNSAKFNVIFGTSNTLSGNGKTLCSSIIVGENCKGYATKQSLFGSYLNAQNISEHSIGNYNVSNKANDTWGDSGNTLFSVGNGTANDARHNAFEIRQNGDIYLTLDGQDVKLQDHLGGASYTAGDGIDITNDVISVTGMVETSAITSAVTSASTDSEIPTAKAVYDAMPSGGGKAIEAGTNISVTTGETADTINCTLPIYSGTNLDGTAAGAESIRFSTQTFFGSSKGLRSIRGRYNSNALGVDSICFGANSYVRGDNSFGVGKEFDSYGDLATIFGYGTQTKNEYETAVGKHNTSNSGSTDADKTLFSVGNGTSNNARHNAFEVRKNGDIYLSSGGTDILLQDHLGGGSITIDPSLDSGSTNAVANSAITNALNAKSDKGNFNDFILTSINDNPGVKFKTDNGDSKTLWLSKINGIRVFETTASRQATNFSLVETSAITTSVTSSSTDSQVPSAKAVNDALGGLKLIKLTESEYAALVTKDPDVLYVVVPDPTNP